MKHFKPPQGHAVVVGYTTFKGFEGRLLPNRLTLYDARISEFFEAMSADMAAGFKTCRLWWSWSGRTAKTEDVYVIGGKATYENFMPLADEKLFARSFTKMLKGTWKLLRCLGLVFEDRNPQSEIKPTPTPLNTTVWWTNEAAHENELRLAVPSCQVGDNC